MGGCMKEKNIKKRKDGKFYVDFTFNKKRIRKFGGYTKEQARKRLLILQDKVWFDNLGSI